MLLRLAQTYKIDIADLAGDGGADDTARLQAVLKDPMFADIDMPSLEISDVATSFPGITEALLRLYTAYREEQLALADRGARRPRPAATWRRPRRQRSGGGGPPLPGRAPQQLSRPRRRRRAPGAGRRAARTDSSSV